MARGCDKNRATDATPSISGDGRPPTRDELSRLPKRMLRQGHNCSPDVYACEWGGGRIVVKDYAPKGQLVRWGMGWPLIAHEGRILRHLAGLEGVPQFRGHPDRFSLAMSAMDGVPFRSRPGSDYAQARGDFVAALAGIIEDMHARGVVHLDLCHRSNILAAPGGLPELVDFTSALRFTPSSRMGRLLTRCFGCADQLAVIKCKRNLAPETLSRQEKHWVDIRRRTRRVWLPRILMDAACDTVRRRPRRKRVGEPTGPGV